MEKHVTLVGILNIVYRSMAIIGAIVLFCLAYGFNFLMKFISHFNHNEVLEIPAEVFSIVQIVLTIIGILILIFAVTGIIGAIGVLRKKEWGTDYLAYCIILQSPQHSARHYSRSV